MNYFKIRVLFLFDTLLEYLELLNGIEDHYNQSLIIKKVNDLFNRISYNFTDIIFKLIVVHTNKLELNIYKNSTSIGFEHIKKICEKIMKNENINYLSQELKRLVKILNQNEFDIKLYSKMVEVVEEIDFICMFEMYSYLLGEEKDSVFSFMLDGIYIIGDFEEEMFKYSNLVLDQFENKINLFKKLYKEDEIKIVDRKSDHIIYEVNGILKIVYI